MAKTRRSKDGKQQYHLLSVLVYPLNANVLGCNTAASAEDRQGRMKESVRKVEVCLSVCPLLIRNVKKKSPRKSAVGMKIWPQA